MIESCELLIFFLLAFLCGYRVVIVVVVVGLFPNFLFPTQNMKPKLWETSQRTYTCEREIDIQYNILFNIIEIRNKKTLWLVGCLVGSDDGYDRVVYTHIHISIYKANTYIWNKVFILLLLLLSNRHTATVKHTRLLKREWNICCTFLFFKFFIFF